jgi:hypothetical protein
MAVRAKSEERTCRASLDSEFSKVTNLTEAGISPTIWPSMPSLTGWSQTKLREVICICV